MLNSNTVLRATASSVEMKRAKHARLGTDKSFRKGSRNLQVQLNACEHTITQWVFATAYFIRTITSLHPCLHIFVCHLNFYL